MKAYSPSIYVACLSAYSAGILHGVWVDATQDVSDIMEDINNMLAESPCPGDDWAIHDYEDFGPVVLGSFASLDTVSEVAQALAEHGPAVGHHFNNGGSIENFSETYYGYFDSEQDFAEHFLDETGQLSQLENIGFPLMYIDLEVVARDLLCGSFWAAKGDRGVYIFRND